MNCLAQLEQPNLLRSLGLVLGDHNPPKPVILFAFPPPSDFVARWAAARRLWRSLARARLPWQAANRSTHSGHRRRTNLDEDKAGTTFAASYRRWTPCTPVQSRRRVRFCFYPGWIAPILAAGWIEDKWWFSLSQFKLSIAELAVSTLAAATHQAWVGANTSPAVFTHGQVKPSSVRIRTWPPATQFDLAFPLSALLMRTSLPTIQPCLLHSKDQWLELELSST